MDPEDRFPCELWLEMFTYLPQDALKHVSLTHRILCTISRPLRFNHFELTLSYDHDIPSLSAAQVHHALQRLNFWVSPDIVPLVRSCRFCLLQQRRQEDRAWKPSGDEYILLRAFFEHAAPAVHRPAGTLCSRTRVYADGDGELMRFALFDPPPHLRLHHRPRRTHRSLFVGTAGINLQFVFRPYSLCQPLDESLVSPASPGTACSGPRFPEYNHASNYAFSLRAETKIGPGHPKNAKPRAPGQFFGRSGALGRGQLFRRS
jgi:hypothetical protein